MKCVIFLAICVAAVVGLPWEYGQSSSEDNAAELAKIKGSIGIKIFDKDNNKIWKWKWILGDKNKKTENKKTEDKKIENKKIEDKKTEDKKTEDKKIEDKKTEVASLPVADVAKFKIKAHGNINVGIKFSNLEEASSQDEPAIWINTDNTGEGKIDVRIGGYVQLGAEQIDKAVQKELAKLGIKEDISTMEVLDSAQLEDIEILSSSENIADLSPAELAKLKIKGNLNVNIKFANPVALEGAANVPTVEPAKFKFKVRGNINIGIKFSNPIATETALAQLAHEEGAVCIYVGNEKQGVHYGGIVKAEDMSEVEIDDIQIVPAVELAKPEIKIEGEGGSKGGNIRIGVKVKW